MKLESNSAESFGSVKLAVPTHLHLLNHPFYQDWMSGKLTKETLQDYAGQYYHHVRAFPLYLEKALTHQQTDQTRNILAENLAEENGAKFGCSHPELWLRFAEGLGQSRSTVETAKLRVGIENVVQTFSKLTNESFESAMGCLYAYESQIPEIAESKIEGLKSHYGIQDEVTLSFFEVHRTADVAHRESLLAVIDSMTVGQKTRVQYAINKSALALWNFLTEIHTTNGKENVH